MAAPPLTSGFNGFEILPVLGDEGRVCVIVVPSGEDLARTRLQALRGNATFWNRRPLGSCRECRFGDSHYYQKTYMPSFLVNPC